MQTTADFDTGSGFHFLKFDALDKARSDTAIVYLHGAGERGSDLSLLTRFGLPAMLAEGRASTHGAVYCPQLEENGTWSAERVVRFLRFVQAHHDSVVLIGYSLGASGVCNVVAEFGAVVPLAIAIAGQAPGQVSGLVHAEQAGVCLLAIQGDLDTWPDTGTFMAHIRAAGAQAVEVVMPGHGHYISEEALAHPTTVAMLREAGVRIMGT